jgi:signal transduction histidine kinase
LKTNVSSPARVYPWVVTLAAVGFVAYWLHAWLWSPPAAAGIALMAVLVMAPPAAILYLSLRRTIQLLASEQAARAQVEAAAGRIRRMQGAIEPEWAPLAAVLAGMSDGVLVLDAPRRVRYCNTRAGELLGLDPSAVVGQDGKELVNHLGLQLIDRRAARSVWWRVITDPHGCPSGEINTADGPFRRVILLSAFPVVDAAGEGLGLVLRDVTDSKVRAARQERERIAMDLHDGVVQSLYGVVLGLTVLERSLNGHAAAVQAPLRKHRARLEAVIEEIRDYIFHLRSREPCEGTLPAGLAAIVEELHDNGRLGVQIDADVEGLDPEGAANILFIVREATSNVIRHACASRVVIRLARVDGRLVLTICDDGGGFDPHMNGRRSGQGLRNMAERARALGGRLTVSSQAGRGTEVRLEVPPPELSEENDRAVREAAAS